MAEEKRFHLLIHDDVRAQITRLHAAYKSDPSSREGKEYVAAIKGLKALQTGREGQYNRKALGSGRNSYDLSDVGELKVPVHREFRPGGYERGESHRLVYREFDPLPTVKDGRVVPNPDALPFRQVLAFDHRQDNPADIAGQRLGRTPGVRAPELRGLETRLPSVGPQAGARLDPPRLPLPPDLLQAARMMQGTAPAAGAVNAPNAAGDTAAKRQSDQNGPSRER
jgi:hypothetical protein